MEGKWLRENGKHVVLNVGRTRKIVKRKKQKQFNGTNISEDRDGKGN